MYRCRDLLKGVAYECIKGNVDVELSAVVSDSRKIVKGCLFICIQGINFDGHTAAAEAAQKGQRRLWSIMT